MTSIALALDRWDPERGGAERAFDRLARHLVRRGHDVTVVALDGAVPAGDDAPRLVRVSGPRLPRAVAPGRFERALGRRLVAAAEREGCDLLVGHRHLPRADLLWPHGGAHAETLAARARARRRRLGPPAGRHRAFVELEARLLAGAARRVVCVSERVRDELARHHPGCERRLVVVPNGVDRARFTPAGRAERAGPLRGTLELPAGDPVLAFAAREPELKGLPVLLDALRGLVGRPWTLVVAGPRELDRWRAAAARAGLPAPRLRFTSHADPAALFAAADLAVHPTWRDTSGLVLLEALSSGTPTVTTDAAGDAELCRDEAVGAVVPPGDVGALRTRIDGWLDRIEADAVDRAHVRARTAGRDEADWLAALERELLAL